MALSSNDAQRFIRKLVIEGFIGERLVVTPYQSVMAYLTLSKKGIDFLSNSLNRAKVNSNYKFFFFK